MAELPPVDPNVAYAELSRQYGLVFGELVHLRLVAAQQAEEIAYLKSRLEPNDGGVGS